MTRIRIALALVSIAVLGLVALLAWRAQQGLAAERAVRHEAVAERAFEEMERALSEFLAREEARPFDHYAYTSPVSGERSPLASGLEPFVIGAFQVDPEGDVTTPLDAAAAAATRVRAAVAGLWPARGADKKDERAPAKLGALASGRVDELAAAPPEERQAPGTTRALAGPGVKEQEERERAAPEAPAPAIARERDQIGAFEALQSLNRAADDRAERKQKVARVARQEVYGAPEAAKEIARAPAAQPAFREGELADAA
ncbi:MAG TPA: hypothetical protein VKH41_10710, partial [Myxococcota bacterium]|nr:hypothetical protein [Myxococcota bacterium]